MYLKQSCRVYDYYSWKPLDIIKKELAYNLILEALPQLVMTEQPTPRQPLTEFTLGACILPATAGVAVDDTGMYLGFYNSLEEAKADNPFTIFQFKRLEHDPKTTSPSNRSSRSVTTQPD